MKKNKPEATAPRQSDLQKLIAEFETLKSEIEVLDQADKESQEYAEEVLRTSVAIHQGNERARRERQVKLENIQELLRPILFPMHH